MKRNILSFFCILCFSAITAQNVVSESYLKTIIEKGFAKGNIAFAENDADSAREAIGLYEEYIAAFNDKGTRSIAENVEDPWQVFFFLSTLYNSQDDTKILSFFDNTVRPYYREKGRKEFKKYFSVAIEVFKYISRPHPVILSQQEQTDKMSALAHELHDEARALEEKSLAVSVSKYMVAWSEVAKNNILGALKWLEEARTTGLPYLEQEKGSQEFFLYLESLAQLAQGYYSLANYSKGIEVADQLINLSYSISSQYLLTGLYSKVQISVIGGDLTSLSSLIESIDSVCRHGSQIDPQLLEASKYLVEQYRSTIQQNVMTGIVNTTDFENTLNEYGELMEDMEEDSQTDLFYYNEIVFQCLNFLILNNQSKKAMDVLEHAVRFVNERFGHIPYATRTIEGMYAMVWHSLGNMPEALRHLHKSEQMFELAADHGLQYYMLIGGFIDILQSAGELAYAKLYIDRVSSFFNEKFDGNFEDIDQIKVLKATIPALYLGLGYTDIAYGQLQKLFQEEGVGQKGQQWDIARRVWAFVNYNKGNFEISDQIFRKNLEIASSDVEKYNAINGLVFSNCHLHNPEAIAFLEEYVRQTRQQINHVMKDFDQSERQVFWEQKSVEISKLSTMVLDQFTDNNKVRELAYNIALYVKSMQDRKIKQQKRWSNISKNLSDNEVAVEFVTIPDSNGVKPVRYGALVLRNEFDGPQYIDLCDIGEVDDIWREVIHTDTTLINRLYSILDKQFYTLVWSKIEHLFHPGDAIFFSTVGMLDRVNHSAVSNGRQRMGDLYSMNQVSSTASINELKQRQWKQGGNAVVYGGIEYSMSTDQMADEAAKYERYVDLAERTEATRGGVSRGALNDELLGTLEEALVIDSVLKKNGYSTKLLTGRLANEESFKALGGHAPQILHIGTHGFALSTTTDNERHFNIISNGMEGRVMQLNPMKYCGLRMAGSNNAWRGLDVPANLEDGILTAYEISQVDLTGCKLVVLSACETALGFNNYIGSGIGLIRALKLAGVESIIASLWEVPDDPTSLLMQHMFTLIAQGTPVREALSKAQEVVRKKYPDPYNWAAFVLIDGLN